MPEEPLTRSPDDQSPGETALEQAADRVQRAMSTMKLVAQDVALKEEISAMSLEQSAAALIEAVGNLSSAVTALSRTLSDVSVKKPAGEAAMKKAMNVFVRAAAELSKVSGSLRAAVSNEKVAAQQNRPSGEASSQQVPGDSGLAQTADRLRQTADSLSNATESLAQSGAARDSNKPPDHPKRPFPSVDIALKDE